MGDPTAPGRAPRPRRRLIAVVASVALVCAGFVVSVGAHDASLAAVTTGFDPADIIDDATMFDGTTMDAAAIQAFLGTEQPSCAPGATCLRSIVVDVPALAANPMCRAVPAAAAQTAAQVIATVGAACGVSPRVILVMLQKEQTLVTGRRPSGTETVDSIYRKATGLGCPDTAACDPTKYGLFNQLYGVAYWLVRYTMPPGTGPGTKYSSVYSWFPVGTPNAVLYNPSAVCGSRTLTIANAATASLYYYTPYQPNAAALAAGWGTGDSCSAYGNRNFFLYFTTWFGSTHATQASTVAPPAAPAPNPTATATADPAAVAASAITAAWSAAGGASGPLGDVAGAVVPVAAATPGYVQPFGAGAVYTSALGTVALPAPAATRYAATGGPAGVLGWPTAVAGATATFEHGLVVTTRTGAWVVTGVMRTAWTRSGSLGAPVADAVSASGGAYQDFAHGRLVITPSTTTTVRTPVLARWVALRAGSGVLGWPTGPAVTKRIAGVSVLTQPFQHGVVVSRSGSALAVSGTVFSNWTAHGGGTGKLGWPRAGAATSSRNGGGISQRFVGGTVYWSRAGGAHPLTGAVLRAYNAQHGTSGALGWPGVTKHDASGRGGSTTTFTHGRIYASSRGAFPIPSQLVTKYLAKRGPAGAMGWPIGKAVSAKGVLTQRFEHGTLSAKAR